MHVTFFKDRFATRLTTAELTLDELATRIRNKVGRDKMGLPWLKLLSFGAQRTEKNCLRHDANVQAASGCEVEHDEGDMTLDAAVAALKGANVQCIVYSSPSWVEGEKERWRVLAPFSGLLVNEQRARMVARLNTVLSGKVTDESFVLSQSYLYGHLVGRPFRVEVLDGECIDRLGDIAETGKPERERPTRSGRAADSGTVAPGRTDEEIASLLALSREEGKWHFAMLRVVASLRGRGMSRDEIYELTAEYCKEGWGDPDIEEMVDGAVRKGWGGPEVDMADLTAKLLALKATVAAAASSGGGGGSMFGTWVPPGIRFDDMYAFLPSHKYIYVPTGDLWPMASVDSILPSRPLLNAQGQVVMNAAGTKPVMQTASEWLDRNRYVEQMTWAPGEPQIVEDKLASEAGWVPHKGSKTFNIYRPPLEMDGDARRAGRWLDLVETLYPDDAYHIVAYMAHRVQKPEEKINHGILLAGRPGIGKDTMLEPLRYGVGTWNFKEASPVEMMGQHNDFLRAVVLRISEARDLGEVNRYALHERMKTVLAAPPDMTRINIKYVPQHYVVNVMGVFITTNHSFDGIYLPPDDRRHYVAATEISAEEMIAANPDYWADLWNWYRNEGGIEDVVAYLAEYPLEAEGFDPKAPPPKTAAFKRIVAASAAPENAELDDIIETMAVDLNGEPCAPVVVTVEALKAKALEAGGNTDLYHWLTDRANRRTLPHRFAACGYTQVVNPDAKDGLWKIKGKRQAVYGRLDVTGQERMEAANNLS